MPRFLVEHVQPGRGYPVSSIEADSLEEARSEAARFLGDMDLQRGPLDDQDETQGLVGVESWFDADAQDNDPVEFVGIWEIRQN